MTTTQIIIDQVSKTYATRSGPVPAIGNMDFSVSEGEFVSLLGPSGCGKSSLLMILAGLIPATSGRVIIEGREVNGPNTEVGIVFQDALLMEWRTVLDNVLIQAELRGLPIGSMRERALNLLSSVGLDGFANKYPRELSGGMRQRVSVVRALVHNPQVLLMDEPFGALDSLTRERMGDELQQLWLQQRKTVFLITHDIAEAVLLSDRVIVLGPRPCHVVESLEIKLPRPRHWVTRESAEFARHTHRIRELFAEMGLFENAPSIQGVQVKSGGLSG